MGERGMNASLSVQVDRLKKSMQNRDKRRDHERRQRARAAEADGGGDPYASARAWEPSNATGGIKLGPAAAATAAVAVAAALEGPDLIHCHLCQVSFRLEAEMQQHVEGPIHRKALARQEALRQRNEALGAMSGAAEAAMAAAAWANEGKLGSGRVSGHVGSSGGPPGPRAAAAPPALAAPPSNAARGRGTPPAGRGGGRPAPGPPERTHADVLAEMRRVVQPLTIGGWAPPAISLPVAKPLPVSDQAMPASPPGRAPSSVLENPPADDAGSDPTEARGTTTTSTTSKTQTSKGKIDGAEDSGGSEEDEGAGGSGGLLGSLIGFGEDGGSDDDSGSESDSSSGDPPFDGKPVSFF